MTASEPRIAITEIDLHAYADGLLDGDPRRKRAVADYLRGHADAAQRVESYAAQNREIQRLYAPVLDEPMPARLHAALHRRTGIAQGPWLRIAASVAVLMAAAAGGWLLGIEQGRTPSPTRAFVEQARANHPPAQHEASMRTRVDAVHAAGALERTNGVAALEFDPPDLSALGYTLKDRRIVGPSGEPMMQMSYARGDGRQLSLFLRNRWQSDDRKVTFSGGGDAAVAHWLDGPLVYGVVATGGEAELTAVAEAIQAAGGQTRRTAPRIAIHGNAPTLPLAGADDEAPAARVVAPEPAVVTPTDPLGPVRVTR